MNIQFHGMTDVGVVRKQNEDAWVAYPDMGLFIVSDGMGGELAGALASKIVVEILPGLIKEKLKSFEKISSAASRKQMEKIITDLSRRVRTESANQPGLEGMGATVLLTLIRGNHAMIAHMGDSRAYLLNENKLKRLTIDHSIVQLLIENGEITEEEGNDHPAKSLLRRFVGMQDKALPETKTINFTDDDTLLLCSDGLHSMISDIEIETILQKGDSPEKICEMLMDAARAAGGNDNITAVVVSKRM